MPAHLVWKPSKRKGQPVAHLRFWLQSRKFFRSLKTTDETAANSILWRANETMRRLEQAAVRGSGLSNPSRQVAEA